MLVPRDRRLPLVLALRIGLGVAGYHFHKPIVKTLDNKVVERVSQDFAAIFQVTVTARVDYKPDGLCF